MLIINNTLLIFYKIECYTKTEIFLKNFYKNILLNSTTPPHIQSTTQLFKNASINKWNGSLDNTPINDNDEALFVPILLGILTPICILSLLSGYYISKFIFFVL